MKTGIELKKKTASIVLAKRSLPTPPACEVGVALDISGSMQDEYQDGIVQEVAERVFALAINFDRDQKLDVWTYDDSQPTYIGTVTDANVDGFINKSVLAPGVTKWGGTSYAPVLKMMDSHYFGGTVETETKGFLGMFKKKSVEQVAGAANNSPVLVFFITDGENFDKNEFEKTLVGLRSKNVYIQIVGIGNANLSYVERVANSEPNAGFCQLRNIRSYNDEQMMEQLISTEFVNWIKKF